MDNNALIVEGVDKKYRLGVVGAQTLSHDINRLWAYLRGKEDPLKIIGSINNREIDTTESGDYVWALKDINFKVKKGEVLGIIGRNGAGKSTLLKVLSKITSPSSGLIRLNGRVGSLLEVGTGFHPELTGKENIFLNGAILGMSKKEISLKLNEIVDFSGIGNYLDTPVKRYSSGMKVRLGFSVAAHLDPEILIIDEVLAVGDIEFQKKCIGKMNDISQKEGRTILFVSHNMSAVRSLCDRGILIDSGKITFSGNINDTISEYLKLGSDTTGDEGTKYITPEDDLCINSKAYFKEIVLLDEQFCNKRQFEASLKLHLELKIQINEKLKDYTYVIVKLMDNYGNYICAITDEDEKPSELVNFDEGEHCLRVALPASFLKPGGYYISCLLYQDKAGPLESKINVLNFNIVDTISYRGQKEKYRKTSIVAPLCVWEQENV